MARGLKQALAQLAGKETYAAPPGADPQLLALVGGFFVFPVSKKTHCASLLGPKVPMGSHQSKLFIFNPDVDGPGAFTVVDVAGKSVSINRCVPAAARVINGSLSKGDELVDDLELDFQLIPDFTSLCCGVAFDQSLATDKMLQTKLELVGGEIGGIRDCNTCNEKWTWKDCRGREKTQRLSSLAVHLSDPVPTVMLTIAPLDGLGQPVAMPVHPIPELNLALVGLFHVPATKADPDSFTVDIAHLDATLALCKQTGAGVSVQFGKRTPKQCRQKRSAASASRGRVGTLVKGILDLIILNNGRPNCGGRQVPI